jgi:hypothetical protein
MSVSLPPNDDRPFVVLLLAIVALRLTLLVVSQHSVSGDEATVGIMAKHIVERGERPVFAYGADYNGGAAVAAYFATIPFALFGMSERSLKLVPFGLGLLAVTLVYLLVRSARGARTALTVAFIYATSLSLMKWNFDARGGYIECQALIPLTFWVLHHRCLKPGGGRLRDDFFLGFLSGFGVYLLQMFIPVGLTACVFLLTRGRVREVWRGLLAFAAGATLGASPLLYFGAPAGAVGFDPLPLLRRINVLPHTLWQAFTRYLPGLLSYENFEGYPELHWLPNGIEYAVLVLAVLSLIVFRWPDLKGLLSGSRSPEGTPPPLEGVLLVYVAVYLILFALHPLADESPRYLLFLEPALSVLVGLSLAEAWARRGAPRAVGAILVALLLLDRGWQTARLLADDRIYGPGGRSDPQTAEILIRFLDGRGLDRVITEDWDLGWRIVFKTRERIAVFHNLNNLHQPSPSAVIVDEDSEGDERVGTLLRKREIPIERYLLAGKAVYAVVGHPGETP